MRINIPALTGVRFLAAFTVVLAHGLLSIALFHDTPRIIAELRNLSALGMSIFFVLSGFVIHLTYGPTIQQPHGLRNFFVARFARLYPLYFVLLSAELFYVYFVHRISPVGHSSVALSYYYTLTQTWWYGVYNDASLVYQFGPLSQVAWSISTEAGFYLAYPVLLFGLRQLRHPGAAVAVFFLHCIAGVLLIGLLIHSYGPIGDFALRTFGEMADGRGTLTGQDAMFRWLIYFSPYSRVLEFIAGCLAAQAYMSLSRIEVGRREHLFGVALTIFSIAAVAFTQILFFSPGVLSLPVSPTVYRFHMSFGYAPACALLIFSCARYATGFSRFLSWRPVIALGDASYSIYLLHMVFFTVFRGQPVEATAANIALRLGMFALVTAGLVASSLVTYRLIEVPARLWLRRWLTIAPGQPVTRAQRWQKPLVAGLALAALIPPLVVTMRGTVNAYRSWRQATASLSGPPPAGTIDVLTAAYGASCVKIEGNATGSVRHRCNGRTSCDYVVNVAILGDPAPGCSKDFKVEWRCTPEGPARSTSLPPEAGLRSVARLTCQGPSQGLLSQPPSPAP